jgi:glycosyltransferase involved in cell wall biosynthesis
MTATSTGSRSIVHVAQVEITRESGMGRVAWHWREQLVARGYDFIHIGPAAIGRAVHPALFPLAAFRHYRRLGLKPAALLVHEPAGMPFALLRHPVIAFSHGLERRGWEAAVAQSSRPDSALRARSRLLFPLWRLRPADFTLAHATALLVLNADDYAYALRRYRRRAEDVFRFRNGVDLEQLEQVEQPEQRAAPAAGDQPATILFIASWLPRKGVSTLVEAAQLLQARGLRPRFLLAGTGRGAEEVLACWPADVRASVQVLPRFAPAAEGSLYARAEIFVLPSFFEGQPLALLQAMAAGCCCIGSDIAGTRDLIQHRQTGLLFAPGDAQGLADCLFESLQSASLRATLGHNARAAVAGRGWEAVASEVADFVEQVIRRG